MLDNPTYAKFKGRRNRCHGDGQQKSGSLRAGRRDPRSLAEGTGVLSECEMFPDLGSGQVGVHV